MEEARLDKESRSLMQDLKQLTMKDGLRRQYHIDYKWDDNIQAKKACQELFGPPGSRFKESEMLSHDLQHTNDDTPILLSPFDATKQNSDSSWKDVSQEEDVSKPGAGRVLNRLLKQIDAQRQQQKSTESGSTEPVVEHCEEELTHELTVKDEDHASETENQTQISDTEPDVTEVTNKNMTSQNEMIARTTTTDDAHDNQEVFSVSSPKLHKDNVSMKNQTIDASLDTEHSSDQSKSQSEILLESSLQNMKNDEALLKSVKDFQQRLLLQHKSCAKIQEQINRLEGKRAAIDAQVRNVIKE